MLATAAVGGALVGVVVSHMTRGRTTRRNKPRRIILVRHGQSLGNIDPLAYETIPDHRLPLTDVGMEQARRAGDAIRRIIGPSRVHAYVSPHTRTMQTFGGMLPAFEDGQIIKVRMEPRIREQDWGNFQNVDEMRLTRKDRHKYGRFYFRFPNGESGADVFDRVTTFFDTIHRSWERAPSSSVRDDTVLIVTHGLTLRLFLMRWFQVSAPAAV